MPPLLDRVVGQELAKRIVDQTLAKRGAIYNFLFFGPDGVGKRRTALLLVKSLLCPQGGCEVCSICQKIDRLAVPDFLLIAPLPPKIDLAEGFTVEDTYRYIKAFADLNACPEPEDKSTIRIGQIEALQERLRFRPLSGTRRVVVLVDIDRMNKEAANSFLKTLEEPPPSTFFILSTGRLFSVIPTIRSRCQLVPFRFLSSNELKTIWDDYLTAAEPIPFNDFGLGSVRETMLVSASKYLNSALEIFRRSPLGAAQMLKLIEAYEKRPLAELVYILLILYRSAIMAKLGQVYTNPHQESIAAKAQCTDLPTLVATGRRLNNALFEVGFNPNKKLFLASLLNALK